LLVGRQNQPYHAKERGLEIVSAHFGGDFRYLSSPQKKQQTKTSKKKSRKMVRAGTFLAK